MHSPIVPFGILIFSSLFFWLYVVITSAELGASLFVFFPGLLADTPGQSGWTALTRFISPVWETTNVFLVAFVVALFAFFPGSLSQLSTTLFTPLCLFLILTGLRFLLMLIFFYGPTTVLRDEIWIQFAFFICSFGAPLVLSWAIANVINPTLIWPFLFLTLTSLCVFAGGPAILPNKHFSAIAAIAYALDTVWLFEMLPLILPDARTTLLWPSLVLLVAFGIVLFAHLARHRFVFFIGLALVSLMSTLSIPIVQFPYLVFPSILLTSAFTATASALPLVIVLVLGLIITIPSLFLLYWLFLFQ